MIRSLDNLFDFCELVNVINQYGSKWYTIQNLYDNLLTPKTVDGSFISLLGCKFDPSVLISDKATLDDVIKSWMYMSEILDTKKILLIYYDYMIYKKMLYETRNI